MLSKFYRCVTAYGYIKLSKHNAKKELVMPRIRIIIIIVVVVVV